MASRISSSDSFALFVLLMFILFAGGDEFIEDKNPGTYVARLASINARTISLF